MSLTMTEAPASHAQGGGVADAPRSAGNQRVPSGQAERVGDARGPAVGDAHPRHDRPTIDTKLTMSPG
jgi:hypothetical protein